MVFLANDNDDQWDKGHSYIKESVLLEFVYVLNLMCLFVLHPGSLLVAETWVS